MALYECNCKTADNSAFLSMSGKGLSVSTPRDELNILARGRSDIFNDILYTHYYTADTTNLRSGRGQWCGGTAKYDGLLYGYIAYIDTDYQGNNSDNAVLKINDEIIFSKPYRNYTNYQIIERIAIELKQGDILRLTLGNYYGIFGALDFLYHNN